MTKTPTNRKRTTKAAKPAARVTAKAKDEGRKLVAPRPPRGDWKARLAALEAELAATPNPKPSQVRFVEWARVAYPQQAEAPAQQSRPKTTTKSGDQSRQITKGNETMTIHDTMKGRVERRDDNDKVQFVAVRVGKKGAPGSWAIKTPQGATVKDGLNSKTEAVAALETARRPAAKKAAKQTAKQAS